MVTIIRLRAFWTVVVALFLAYAVYQYLRVNSQAVPVVVVTQEIPARTRLQPSMLKVVEVASKDRDAVAIGAFGTVAETQGLIAMRAIQAGEVLRHDPALVQPEKRDPLSAQAGTRLSYFLPEETRAVVVTLDSQGALGNKLHTGDHVDVIFTSRDNSTGGVYAALVVAQAVVLDLEPLDDKNAAQKSSGQFNVTLLVTSQQALDVTLAKRKGSIDLALSAPDARPVPLPPASPLKFTQDPGNVDRTRTGTAGAGGPASPSPEAPVKDTQGR